MKKLSILLFSLFISSGLLAQLQGGGPSSSYPATRGASEASLYSQMIPHTNINSVAAQELPDVGFCRLQAADDFIVPGGGGWDISRIEVLGNYWNANPNDGPANSFIVEIYMDEGGLPSTSPLHTQSGLTFTENAGLFSIPLSSGIHLPTGQYWISVMAEMSFDPNGQWGWAWHAAPQQNLLFANQNPCDLPLNDGVWPTSWAPASNTWPSRANYDVCFAIYGSPAIPISNWAILFGIFLIGAFMLIRYRRSLA